MRIVNSLDLDNPTLLSKHGSWKHAKNIQISENGSYSESEDKLEQFKDYGSYQYLGKIVTPDDAILFHYVPSSNGLAISKLSTTSQIFINDVRYKDKTIHGTHTYNYKGELIIVFATVEFDNAPEILTINLSTTSGFIQLNSSQYDKLLLHPNYYSVNPNISNFDVVSGGSLLSGTYFVGMCYEDDDGNKSDYVLLSNKIVVHTLKANTNVNESNKPSGSNTGKSINITISNLNPNYNKIRLIVLYYKGETLDSIKLLDKLYYNNNTVTHTISTINGFANRSLEEVLIGNIKYIKAKSIVSNANKLLLYNIETNKDYFEQFQNVANNVVIRYHSDKVFNQASQSIPNEVRTFINPRHIYYDMCFKSGEVYCFYIGFKSKKGGFISVNHIPAYANDNSNASDLLEGYTTDGRYSSDFPTYANQNIKVHKFPEFIDYQANSLITVGRQRMLGVNLSNIEIPDDLKSICSGWQIFYAERTFDNMTRVGTIGTYDSVSPVIKSTALFGFDLEYNKYPLGLIKEMRKLVVYTHLVGSLPNLVLSQGFSSILGVNKTNFFNNPSDHNDKLEYQSGIGNNYGDFITVSNDISVLKFTKALFDCISSVKPYTNINNQTLVSIPIVYSANTKTTGNINYGDTYVCQTGRHVMHQGANRVFYYLTESIYNLELRHEGIEEYQKIYPMSNIDIIRDMPKDKGSYINDEFGNSYDKTYNKLNNIKNPTTDEKELEYQFRNRIAISDVNSSESTTFGWRIFRPNNYYDVGFDRGEGVKLTSADKRLFIQNRFGLYLAQIKDVLQLADNSQAWLGTGDLFDRPPQEVMFDTNGGIGCRDYNSILYSPIGYVVCDRDRSSIFVISDESFDMTNNLFKRWFKLNVNNDKDNIINIGFDSDRKRFIMNLNDHILSFSILTKGLTSFHDYKADDVINNRLGTFIIYGNKVNKFIDQPTDNVSYIDVNFTYEPEMQKLFQSIIWETEYSVNNVIDWSKTINKIMVYNDSQCTGILDVNTPVMWYDNTTGVHISGKWFYNNIFDAVLNDKETFLDNFVPNGNVNPNGKNWYNRSQFISKFITIRLQSDNTQNQRIKFFNLQVQLIKDVR